MIESLKKLFGSKKEVDYREMINDGAVILDVRTKREFEGGHIKSSINVPGDTLPSYLPNLTDKSQTIITCCASGVRSGLAKRTLEKHGYSNVYNGGGWNSLNSKLM